jgi:hypothetical protein
MKEIKEAPVHLDKLGKTIEVGVVVAFPESNSLQIGTVYKITNKMIAIQRLPKLKWRSTYRKYPADVVIINDADVTMYVLKHS